MTVAASNGCGTTFRFTILPTSAHPIKSLSLGRTLASTSRPPSAAFSRLTMYLGRSRSTTAYSALTSIRLALSTAGLSSTSLPVQNRVDGHSLKLFSQSAPTNRNRSRTRTTHLQLACNPLNLVPHQATNCKPLPSLSSFPRQLPNKALLALLGSPLVHRSCNANLSREKVGRKGGAAGFNSKRADSNQEEVAGARGCGHGQSHYGDSNQPR